MHKLEEEMQRARTEFGVEKKKLTEEFVCHDHQHVVIIYSGVSQDETKSEYHCQMDENRKIGK